MSSGNKKTEEVVEAGATVKTTVRIPMGLAVRFDQTRAARGRLGVSEALTEAIDQWISVSPGNHDENVGAPADAGMSLIPTKLLPLVTMMVEFLDDSTPMRVAAREMIEAYFKTNVGRVERKGKPKK